MRSHFLVLSLILLSVSSNAFAGQFVLLNEQAMQSVKADLAGESASKEVKDIYKRLIKDADKLLNTPNYSVTDKTIIPPGATANDFVSISSKAWPDESKPGGFPWVKLDETNPDTKTDKVDRQRINDMAKAVFTLSQAYYFSENDEYAKKASTMLKVWFLATKTRMSPHLKYAQTIPGVDKSSSSGIMDGRLIPYNILDSINLIRNSGHWSERFDNVMNQWFGEYLRFLSGSNMAKSVIKKKDRNASWYYFQTIALAWYLDDKKALSRNIKQAKSKMKEQFNGKGGLVSELGRSRSYRDSCFSMEGLTGVAVIAKKAGKNLWKLPAKGIDYLTPAIVNGDWTDSGEEINVSDCIVAISRYAQYSDSAELKTTVSNLFNEIVDKGKKSSDDRRVLKNLTLLNPQQ